MPPKYEKVDQREHVLNRPNMYIGSTDAEKQICWVINEENNSMEKKELFHIPALLKIFDEIITNALDHIIRLNEFKTEGIAVKEVKDVQVKIDKESGEITVYNSGDGIDIEYDEKNKCYNPELLFGHMLSSSNYDDSKERKLAGTNGIGSTAANIFSTSFKVETVDHTREKLYEQTFTDNMSKKTEPKIAKYTKYPFTRITFTPDYSQFKCNGLSDDLYKVLATRVYDACACTPPKVKIFLNDVSLQFKDFEKYVDLYIGSKSKNKRVYINANGWEVIVATSSEGVFEQVSFVNGIKTLNGGKHVDYIVNQLTKKISDKLKTKNSSSASLIKPSHIKENLFVFVKCTIINPAFNSQSKECLTTPVAKFGSTCEIDDKAIDKIIKDTDIADRVNRLACAAVAKSLKKTDGSKTSKIHGIPKLNDAQFAGTAKSDQAILILCEGDSAATFCVSGLAALTIEERKKFGIFPLRGKVLNVNASESKVEGNEEITALKKIIGLETGKKYSSTKELRYGHVMICTDADTDGYHIRGLVFNIFQTLWPSLFEIDGFFLTVLTPIVRCTKGKITLPFYTLTEYENWKSEHENESGWTHKYFKGLGTNSAQQARDIFKALNMINYTFDATKSHEAMDLAFNKKRPDDRKKWLATYDRNDIIDNAQKDVEYSEFVHKELIHFSVYNLERAIPSMVDGFKKSIRKIMYSAFKRNLIKEVRVSQFAGVVSEISAYHHGEASLHEAIIGLAQDYVGSNNIHFMEPVGQFGTRIHGGKDHASPRYIHTFLSPITRKIFLTDDEICLNYLDDDGDVIEPEFFVPIIPTLLVNGACGIATGYSTNIPCYNPKDIVHNIKQVLIDDTSIDDLPVLRPWYQGFKGEIFQNDKGIYRSKGIYKRASDTTVEVTELPIQYWTMDFKALCEEMIKDKNILKDYEARYTDTAVNFKLTFVTKAALDNLWTDGFDDMFGMVSTKGLATSNMHAFDANGKIKRYATPNEILMDFVDVRLMYYKIRKERLLNNLRDKMNTLEAKVTFIMDVIEGRLVVFNTKRAVIETYMDEHNYLKIGDSYDYLIKMPIQSLTRERKDELVNELAKAKKQLEELEKKTIHELWLDDLAVLESAM